MSVAEEGEELECGVQDGPDTEEQIGDSAEEESGEEASGAQDVGDVGHGYNADGGSWILLEGVYRGDIVNDEVFEELRFRPEGIQAANAAWNGYVRSAETPELAGEALYAAIYDAAPNLQWMYKTPRAIMGMRYLRAFNGVMANLTDPKSLKAMIEGLAFAHLGREVTAPRVAIFRDAIVDFIAMEAGTQCTNAGVEALRVVLNYTGGALLFVKTNYGSRLKILSSSWATANKRPPGAEGGDPDAEAAEREVGGQAIHKETQQRGSNEQKKGHGSGSQVNDKRGGNSNRHADRENIAVPTTFPEMFRFNAAVMGFGEDDWMSEVLFAFDAMVCNVANSFRFQEECDVLSLRLAKCHGPIELSDFKAVMLASLRSLVPKAWDSDHEGAWGWMWQNAEHIISAQLGKPARQELVISRLLASLEDKGSLSQQVYCKLFQIAPASQNYFKQSATRLQFVSERVLGMTLELFKAPRKLVDDLSACGLRHVGYGVPPELCAPVVCAYVEVVRQACGDSETAEAFEWSLGLISRIIARVINEGSTMVMRAINANSGKLLNRAVACAPRSARAAWVLSVTAGSQSISPLMWAVETGAMEAAEAILRDLLTIRADRDRYYYGVDDLFGRHPDVIRRLCMDAPGLLPTLLDGLIWRSRLTDRGQRRIVYFVKHLVVRDDGGLSQAIEWISLNQDPKIACHPVVSYVIDLVWSGVAARAFLLRKVWLLLTTIVFMISQVILNSGLHDGVSDSVWIRLGIFVCRGFIYTVSWPSLALGHIRRGRLDIAAQNVVRIGRLKIPAHLFEFNSVVSLSLCVILLVMLALCPILHCLGKPSADGRDMLFTERCEAGDRFLSVYAFFSMCGMLCYWFLLADLSVFSNRVSAFAIIVGHVLSEVGLFLLGLVFALLAFATAIVALKDDFEGFESVPDALQSLMRIFLDMGDDNLGDQARGHEVLFAPVVVFVFLAKVYMVNLLIAQLSCVYSLTYLDMLGWARLKRGEVCVASMGSVSAARWGRFVESLRLEEPCEFGEGDVGMPGAIQTLEPAGANVTTSDMIRRFGGSTSLQAVWPEDEDSRGDDASDRIEKVEGLVKRVLRKLEKPDRHGGNAASGSGMSSMGPSRSNDSSNRSRVHE